MFGWGCSNTLFALIGWRIALAIVVVIAIAIVVVIAIAVLSHFGSGSRGGQGGHPSVPAALDIRGQAVWAHAG